MTVHKAQGMTLDCARLSLSRAFDYGQVYVALSRVSTLEGLFLESWNSRNIKAHPKVIEFYRQLENAPKVSEKVAKENKKSSDTAFMEAFIQNAEKKTKKKTPEKKENPRKNSSISFRRIPEGSPNCLKGKVFLVSGLMDSITREDVIQLIEKHGGKVVQTMSESLTHLVAGNQASGNKLKMAKEKKLPILDEESLFRMIEKTEQVKTTVVSIMDEGETQADHTLERPSTPPLRSSNSSVLKIIERIENGELN